MACEQVPGEIGIGEIILYFGLNSTFLDELGGGL